ncbi:hypothetical protein IHV10_07270 [Fictibacillus sp. 5RED26]|uniref:P-loop NTPase fold protein n=1 Tax=Fictibacillus sp. 5RED26 TaxID=2745876 RepID=UPI0018CE4E04|nr:P-loop NTPase fold protein [Fictibacillus sp. 5RED26]MBH0156160.1 hypothetical protein [Fictibacillus sp. 5RED26]
MKANEIIKVLNQFKDYSYQRILINGTWGIGKTKYVLDFKEGHSEACYVSLFGKKDIDSIIQEIYFQILENVPNSGMKKVSTELREKLKNVNFRLPGVSISVPLIGNLHKTLYKELDKKDTFIIIFDDLERKHDDLNIKEILGLIDSFAKVENIKTVLLADTDQLEDKDKDIFKNYKEKTIDKTYTIDEYAGEAPIEIMGEQIWNVIEKYTKEFKFKNLRTFEKTKLFINEVVRVIGEDNFTDKFTKDDIYRMCLATIIFRIEHKSELVLVDDDGSEKSKFNKAYYKETPSGHIEYALNYILKNSLDNSRNKEIFYYIFKWYDSGSYPNENLLNLIASINNYEDSTRNFYSSQEEIILVIENCRKYLNNLNGNESLQEIISKISTAFSWCEVLSINFGFSEDEILSKIEKNISSSIDFKKGYNGNDFPSGHVDSGKVRNIIISINQALRVEYYKQLIMRIKESYETRTFNEIYLDELSFLINHIDQEAFKDTLLNAFNENQYFFPIPFGRITEEQWRWCYHIEGNIRKFDIRWGLNNFHEGFKNYLYYQEIIKEDKMLQHRLEKLFGKGISHPSLP